MNVSCILYCSVFIIVFACIDCNILPFTFGFLLRDCTARDVQSLRGGQCCQFVNIVCKICTYYLFLNCNISAAREIYNFFLWSYVIFKKDVPKFLDCFLNKSDEKTCKTAHWLELNFYYAVHMITIEQLLH